MFLYFGTCFCVMMLVAMFPRGKLSPKGRSVLITGCDTGFGLNSAKRLHTAGMHVFAGFFRASFTQYGWFRFFKRALILDHIYRLFAQK